MDEGRSRSKDLTAHNVHLPPPPAPHGYISAVPRDRKAFMDSTNMQTLLQTPQSLPRDGKQLLVGPDASLQNAGMGPGSGFAYDNAYAAHDTPWPTAPTFSVLQTGGVNTALLPPPAHRQHSGHGHAGALLISPGASPAGPHDAGGPLFGTPTRFEALSRANGVPLASSGALGARLPPPSIQGHAYGSPPPQTVRPPRQDVGPAGDATNGGQKYSLDHMPPLSDDGTKPPFSYAMLIGMAILRSPQRKLTLSQIYSWINDTFSWYRKSNSGWQNSIRHNLSLNKAFQKQERPKSDPGKGHYWIVSLGFEDQFINPPTKRRSNATTASNAAVAASNSSEVASAPKKVPTPQASQSAAHPPQHQPVASAGIVYMQPSMLAPERQPSPQTSFAPQPKEAQASHIAPAVHNRSLSEADTSALVPSQGQRQPSRPLQPAGHHGRQASQPVLESPTKMALASIDSTPPDTSVGVSLKMLSRGSHATLSNGSITESGDEQAAQSAESGEDVVGFTLKRPRPVEIAEPARKRFLGEMPSLANPPTPWWPHLNEGIPSMSWDAVAGDVVTVPSVPQVEGGSSAGAAVVTPPRRPPGSGIGLSLDGEAPVLRPPGFAPLSASKLLLSTSPSTSLRQHRAYIQRLTTPALGMHTLMASPGAGGSRLDDDEAPKPWWGSPMSAGLGSGIGLSMSASVTGFEFNISPEKSDARRRLFGDPEARSDKHVSDLFGVDTVRRTQDAAASAASAAASAAAAAAAAAQSVVAPPGHLGIGLSPAAPLPSLVTPVRRPFDTPIRDQRYVFSPYKHSPEYAGSPRR